MRDLIDIQVSQLERLISFKKIAFKDCYLIIFSDYPSVNFINELLEFHILSDSLKRKLQLELKILQ